MALKVLLHAMVPAAVLAAAPYCVPGQKCFPSAAELGSFNRTVSGRLTMPIPYGSVCYQGHFDEAACALLVRNKTDPFFRETIPAAMAYTNNEFDENGRGCPIPAQPPSTPLTTPCVLGGLATYILEAEEVSDIVAGVKFAARHNLRLRIKNTGHDYFGRSTAPGAFTIRTANFKTAELKRGFEPVGCQTSTDVMAIGTGVTSLELLQAADQAGVITSTGYSPSVAAGGGYLIGGGTGGPLTRLIGYAVDNVVQFDVVKLDGTVESVSACRNPDLFWALRGGGGGFAVVTTAYTKAHPAPAAVNDAPRLRPEFTVGISSVGNHTLSVLFTRFFNSTDEIISADASLGMFDDLVNMPGVTPGVVGLQFSTWLQAYLQGELPIVLVGDHVGVNLLLNSRIMPEPLLSTATGRSTLTTYFLSMPAAQGIIMEWVGGGAASQVGPDQTAIHPDWRSGSGYLAVSTIDPSVGPTTAAQNATIAHINQLGDQFISHSCYMNEDNKIDDDFQQRFWGSNYARLLEIKKEVDPAGIWSCSRCVGSEIFGT